MTDQLISAQHVISRPTRQTWMTAVDGRQRQAAYVRFHFNIKLTVGQNEIRFKFYPLLILIKCV